ncbi:MAG: NnrS family protein, partial [Sphingomonadaceae bacterium]
RNKPILIVLLLFTAACGLDHAAAMGLTADPAIGMRAGFALILLLIAIIGGRIIPAFTRNWLTKHGCTDGLPIMANRLDHAVLAVTAIALAGWVFAPAAHPVAWLLLVAGASHAVRLTRWAGLRAVADPLVFVLHVAYAWLPAGLLLLGAATLWPIVPVSSAMHALGAGAMAAMTLAVMTRATRGHTGRPLEADGATVAIYVLVNLGALLRVAAPLLPFDYMLSIRLAGGLWGGAFLLFMLIYGRMALRRPANGQA